MITRYVIYGARNNKISELLISETIGTLENEGYSGYFSSASLLALLDESTVIILEAEDLYNE